MRSLTGGAFIQTSVIGLFNYIRLFPCVVAKNSLQNLAAKEFVMSQSNLTDEG